MAHTSNFSLFKLFICLFILCVCKCNVRKCMDVYVCVHVRLCLYMVYMCVVYMCTQCIWERMHSVYMCISVHKCTHWTNTCGGQRLMLMSLSVSLYLVLWDKFSHLNLEFTKQAPGIPLFQPSHCWYYRRMSPYLAFYMDAGYLNSGPHACVTISFSIEEHKCIGNDAGASSMHLFVEGLRKREMGAALDVLLLALVGASFVDLFHLSPTKLWGEGTLYYKQWNRGSRSITAWWGLLALKCWDPLPFFFILEVQGLKNSGLGSCFCVY